MTYKVYPDAASTFTDVRDALNWEASGEKSTFATFHYVDDFVGNINEDTFKNDVYQDIYVSRIPLIIDVNDKYLKDWINPPGTAHFITILGFNFNNNTMTYDETCGQVSCNTQGIGIYVTSIDTLWNAMVNDNGNGGIIW